MSKDPNIPDPIIPTAETPDNPAKPDRFREPSIPHSPSSPAPQSPLPELRQAAAETTDFETTIAQLPEDQRIIALLGIRREVDIIQIPEPFCAITIQINTSALKEVREALKSFALPCSSDFTGETSDERITLTYIIANSDLLDQIHRTIRRIDRSSEVYKSEERTLAVKIPKSRLISLGRQRVKRTLTLSTTAETVIPQTFETVHATSTSLENAQKDKETGTNIPQRGHCTYLMMDQTFLQAPNPKDPNLQKLMDEIELIRKSDHFHITAYNGYIVMIGTSERSGSSLTAMAQRFYRTIPGTCIYLGAGDVVHTSDNKFSITGFPADGQQKSWRGSTPPGVYLTNEFHQLVTDPTKRDSALCSIETRYQEAPNLHRLVSFRPKASARIGGPDRLIGYDKELQELETALTDRKNKLTFIKGPAGIGKSRLIHEALQRLPGAIYCSVDPFSKGSNAPGYGLMTMTEQIADKFKDEPLNSPIHRHPHTQTIMDFTRKSQKEKLNICTQSPQQVTDICFNALSLLNKGNSVFVLDDMHHADTASVNHLTHLAYRYMTEAGGKVLMGMREEEIFKPKTVRDLEKSVEERFGKEAVKTIPVTGLNFSDDKIARDFTFYSFKPEQREGKVLGPWYRKLGRAAERNPFVMKSLMDGILADPDENLETLGDTILLRTDTDNLIERILKKDMDLNTYYRGRIRKLTVEARTLLQCIALAGGKISAEQIVKIAREAAELTTDQVRTSKAELERGRYLITDEDDKTPEEQKNWELQHPTIRDLIVESIEDSGRGLTLAQKVYETFNADRDTPADVKLSIALQIARDKNAPDLRDNFWQNFAKDIIASLGEALTLQATGRTHQIATASVAGEKAPQKILEARAALRQGQAASLPNHLLAHTIIISLLETAETAVTLGRFDEALSCIQELEEVSTKNRELDVDMARAYSILFQKAYLERNIRQMKETLDKLRSTGRAKTVQLATAEIKLAFREHKWDDVVKIFNENHGALEVDNETHKRAHNGSPHPEYIEILRLVRCRSRYEALRGQLLEGLDADVELQAGLITPENARQLLEIQRSLDSLEETRRAFPLSFTPHCGIPFLEQAGITHAFLGNHEKALEALNEAWRISSQAEFHEQEARIAKLIIDVLAMMAISTTSRYPTPTTHGITTKRAAIAKKPLLQALKVRREQGMVPLAHIPNRNNFFHLGIRCDSIRIAGLLACAYEEEVEQASADPRETQQKARLREELEEVILTAFKDFSALNDITKAQKAEREKSRQQSKTYDEDAETAYYVAPYMGHILAIARKLGIEIPNHILNTNESPFIEKESLRAGYEVSRKLNDTGLGEIERKQAGYIKLATILNYVA